MFASLDVRTALGHVPTTSVTPRSARVASSFVSRTEGRILCEIILCVCLTSSARGYEIGESAKMCCRLSKCCSIYFVRGLCFSYTIYTYVCVACSNRKELDGSQICCRWYLIFGKHTKSKIKLVILRYLASHKLMIKPI